MGARMAARLLEADYDLVVYNRNPERTRELVLRGARSAPTPRAAATGRDIVLSVVRDVEASEQVWLQPDSGALWGMQPGALAVESSTVTPAWVRTLAARTRSHGVELLDAPVVGSRPQAEAGQLVHLVGGSRAALERCSAVFEVLGSGTHHIGDVGAGSSLKLAVNALLAVQVAAFAEALSLCTRLGIDEGVAQTALAALPVTSPAAKAALSMMRARNYAPLFPIELVAKDLEYARAAGASVGAETAMLQAAHELYARALALGLAQHNVNGVFQLFA